MIYIKILFKKPALIFGFLFFVFTSFGQSYLGWTTKQVNFRSGAGTEFEIISTLSQGTQIFIISKETINDFYNVIDIATDKEGYLHKSFVKLGKQMDLNEEGLFSVTGKSVNEAPQIDIFNNTYITMTLKLNNEKYIFSPFEKKTINHYSGKCAYRASAPGVIPSVGSEIFESNNIYSWEFYILTERK